MPGATLTTQLGYANWQRVGFPQVRAAGHIDGTEYYSWGTSPEPFAAAPDGVIHRLTFAEWEASGFQPAESNPNEGFQKFSWSGSIARMDGTAAGEGCSVSFAEWQKEDFPSPQVVRRFPNDEFCMYAQSPDIYYFGPSASGAISYSQWRAAGSPPPTRCVS